MSDEQRTVVVITAGPDIPTCEALAKIADAPHPGIDRMWRLREDLAQEIFRRERELAGLRAKLAGFDEAVAIARECEDEELATL